MSKMKSYIARLLLVFVIITLTSLAYRTQNPSEVQTTPFEEMPDQAGKSPVQLESLYVRLSVKGHQLVNEKDEPVVLRGVSFGWHMWWPRFYKKINSK